MSSLFTGRPHGTMPAGCIQGLLGQASLDRDESPNRRAEGNEDLSGLGQRLEGDDTRRREGAIQDLEFLVSELEVQCCSVLLDMG